jgi:hypothetical protein
MKPEFLDSNAIAVVGCTLTTSTPRSVPSSQYIKGSNETEEIFDHRCLCVAVSNSEIHTSHVEVLLGKYPSTFCSIETQRSMEAFVCPGGRLQRPEVP